MKIEDFFEAPESGLLVSGNGNLVAHLSKDQIKDLIAKGVELLSNGKMYHLIVKGLDVSTSITGKINITMAIELPSEVVRLERGLMILTSKTED